MQKTKQNVTGLCQIHDLWIIKITFKPADNQLLSGNSRSNPQAIRGVKIPQNPSMNSDIHTTWNSLQEETIYIPHNSYYSNIK